VKILYSNTKTPQPLSSCISIAVSCRRAIMSSTATTVWTSCRHRARYRSFTRYDEGNTKRNYL